MMKAGASQAKAGDAAGAGRGGISLPRTHCFGPASSRPSKAGRGRNHPGPPPGLVHRIPHKAPFFQSRASGALIVTTIIVCLIASGLPYTPLGKTLGFSPLPPLYWLITGGFMLAYATTTHLVKSWFIRRWGY